MNINKLIITLAFCFSFLTNAQTNQYKGERDKVNDLVHTKLDVKFDIPNSLLFGEAWITLTPHFSPTSKVTLDAKGMLIHQVMINGMKAPYNYFENKELIVELDKTYQKEEKYTIYIKYTSQPEKVVKMGASEAKGLYFIDPRDEDTEKPTQIWTEGETENNSVWFPTIDTPNQKSTQEIAMTVPKEFVTLSNGTLINQKENTDGTRTDIWKQEQKHAPYLFFMAVGEFSVVKDTWKGKPIEYYVEKKYENVARDIFGKTPRMLQFFEDLLGVEYPWDKYSQIVVRDYISGAMENTTAVSHSASAYQDKGELIDENSWESTIAHEVFHHWFGDLVTAESWANLTMNEAFANYSEYLWFEHEYGKEYADDYLMTANKKYFKGGDKSEKKHLIRFNYDSPNDMFDAITYEKGGAILHMLRNYLGDAAFFAGLKKYLIDNKFGTAEAHQLRLALEDVSGKDLNWFFNQWFFGKGHPKIKIRQVLGQFEQKVTIDIIQNENVFEFPLTIDVYEQNGKASHKVWIDGQRRSFEFPLSSKLKAVVVEPTGTLLSEIIHEKTLDEWIYQYDKAENYLTRRNALEYISKDQDDAKAFKTMTKALSDKSFKLRIFALENLDLKNKYSKGTAIKVVENLAKNDKYTLVQAAANITLAKLVDPKYINHFSKAMNSESYKVVESAVIALYQLDKQNTLQKVDALSENVKENMSEVLTGYYLENRDDKYMTYISKYLIRNLFFSRDAKTANTYKSAFQWIAESNNKEAISNLVNSLTIAGKQYKKYGGDIAATNFLRQMVDLQRKTDNTNKKELELVIRTGMARLME
ncbi:MAG: M1 family metallopeptidase [Flavobacteriaceae bacterium]|nr:M1 family metallopeptidase [Flavobacteriaceae bacterium]